MSNFWDDVHNQTCNNEADVEVRLVIPLLMALGYNKEDIRSKYPVVFQEGRKGRKPEADFVIFNGPLCSRNTSLIVVEAKAPGETFHDAKSQGESYAFNARAPFLLITDGRNLELWQLNVSIESECVISASVSSLASVKGQLESYISKSAAIGYCQSLHNKNIITYAQDYGAYLSAELRRTSSHRVAIARTLSLDANVSSKEYESSQLLSGLPDGAAILAPSGYGKTTLSNSLFIKSIIDSLSDDNDLLPFDLPLPDLAQTHSAITDFLCQRLSAHHPGTTIASLCDLFRVKGAVLFCDGFDRLSCQDQGTVEADLRNLKRDYPKLQIFVFSRSTSNPNLSLPCLNLKLLTYEQQCDFVESTLDGDQPGAISLHMFPQILLDLCRHPFLFDLVLLFWEREGRLPSKIDQIFRSWLDVVILAAEGNASSSINRESALIAFAKATVDSPISRVDALALLRDKGISDSIFDEMVRCDAISVNGHIVELQHEALADYLRVLDILSLGSEEILQKISTISLDVDSLLPVLLIAMLPSRSLQQSLWHRLASVDIPLYLNALRYRADVSGEMVTSSQKDLDFQYLQDFLEGLTFPLEGFFPQILDVITQQFTGDIGVEIAITGEVTLDPKQVAYAFHQKEETSGSAITVGQPSRDGCCHYVNLELMKFRLDSGRLLGAARLRDSLLHAVEDRSLKGGTVWASERLVGRLRYLTSEFNFSVGESNNLDNIQSLLMPHINKVVLPMAFRKSPKFTIGSLIQDIEYLRSSGMAELDLWWIRLGLSDRSKLMKEDILLGLLDEHFRRVQLAYAEVIENSFGVVAQEFGFYATLPVRWDLAVVNRREESFLGRTMYTQWHPVSSWDDVGADTEFAADLPERFTFRDFSEIDDELTRLGRLTMKSITWGGFQPVPQFDGNNILGGFDGETSVMQDVCELISSGIKSIFSELPGRD